MRLTCNHVQHMSKMIQIRNVPDDLHRRLKVRAAQEGTTLSDYLLREVGQIADKPTMAELSRRLKRQDPADFGGRTAAELIHEGREPEW